MAVDLVSEVGVAAKHLGDTFEQGLGTQAEQSGDPFLQGGADHAKKHVNEDQADGGFNDRIEHDYLCIATAGNHRARSSPWLSWRHNLSCCCRRRTRLRGGAPRE